jgi:hypothetical protein
VTGDRYPGIHLKVLLLLTCGDRWQISRYPPESLNAFDLWWQVTDIQVSTWSLNAFDLWWQVTDIQVSTWKSYCFWLVMTGDRYPGIHLKVLMLLTCGGDTSSYHIWTDREPYLNRRGTIFEKEGNHIRTGRDPIWICGGGYWTHEQAGEHTRTGWGPYSNRQGTIEQSGTIFSTNTKHTFSSTVECSPLLPIFYPVLCSLAKQNLVG